MHCHHWQRNTVILVKFVPLAASNSVKMTAFGKVSYENFIKITFLFQWWYFDNKFPLHFCYLIEALWCKYA